MGLDQPRNGQPPVHTGTIAEAAATTGRFVRHFDLSKN